MRFLVCSRSRGADVTHLVQLDAIPMANGMFNGQCSCENFQWERQRNIAVATEPSDATRCEHLKIVRNAILDLSISRASKHDEDLTAA